VKIGPAVRPVHRIEKRDSTGQDSQKSHKGVIIHLVGEKTPTRPICTKICVMVAVPDVIRCAKFGTEFSGLRFYRGSNFRFLLVLNGLTAVQGYCAACDD